MLTTVLARVDPILEAPRLRREAEPHRRRYYHTHHHPPQPNYGKILETKAVLGATAIGFGLILAGLSQATNGKK